MFEPTWDASEQPKELINVTPEEVPFAKKYLSKGEGSFKAGREEEEAGQGGKPDGGQYGRER